MLQSGVLLGYHCPDSKSCFFRQIAGAIGSSAGNPPGKECNEGNHSPNLVFEPNDEDEKDYTQVIAYINAEFAEIRKEEKRRSGEENKDTTPITTHNTTPKTTREKILTIITGNPCISKKEIAEAVGISVDGVKYHLKKMSDNGILHYVGTSRKGEWRLLPDEKNN